MARAALPAKLQPRRQAQALDRQRLFGHLDAAAERALTWVQGPAGAGKTTLVSSWLARRTRSVLWYRADAGDADLATVFAFLAQGATALTRKRALRLPALTPEYLLDVPGFTRRFMRLMLAALPPDLVLVVDGIEQTPGDAWAGLVPAVLAELLPGQRLVITSREAPLAALARGLVEGAVEVIGWRELQLDADEALALAAPLAVGRADALRLHRLCGGWAAGFRLGLHHLRLHGELSVPASAWLDEQLFPYFASEMFEQADAATRSVLLGSALLPAFGADALARLMPDIDAQPIVQGLYRRHFFIDRSEATPPVYRYHDLFREFLLQQGRERMPPDERRRLLRLAADVLLPSAQPEDAAPLLHEAQDWDALAQLWCRIAPGLLMQGRHAALVQGLLALPKPRLDEDAWALYWLGAARLMLAPADARVPLEAAFAIFQSRADRIGSLLACSAVLQSYLIEYADVTPVDRWVDDLETLLFAPGDVLPPEVEAEALSATVVLMIRARHPALVSRAVTRARLMQQQSLPGQTRIKLAFFLLQGMHFRGEWREGLQLISAFDPVQLSQDLPPLMQVLWHNAAALAQAGCGEFVAGVAALATARDVAARNGLLVLEVAVAGNEGMGAVSLGDVDLAMSSLAIVHQHRFMLRPLERAQAHLLEGLLAYVRGDLPAADELLGSAMRGASDGGAQLFRAPAAVAHSVVQIERGDTAAASRTVGEVEALAESTGSPMLRHSALFVRAWIALRGRDEAEALALLRQALSLGREHGLGIVFPWCPSVMLQELGVLALRDGIEPELMARMLAARRIAPPGPDADPWPWPLRIRSLGRFELLADGRPLQWGAKVPRKPLELLQALLALDGGSGRGAAVPALIDELWPDAPGDAAQNAFNVGLSRLRKLLGDAQAVQQRDGRLYLDRDRVWTDLAALQRLAERADSVEQPQDVQALAERLFDVCRGPFLADHAAPWAAACRQRQRERFSRAAARLGESLRRQQHPEVAERLHLRLLDMGADASAVDGTGPGAVGARLRVVRR